MWTRTSINCNFFAPETIDVKIRIAVQRNKIRENNDSVNNVLYRQSMCQTGANLSKWTFGAET